MLHILVVEDSVAGQERVGIRVALVGNDPLARSGLAALLAQEPGILVAAQLTMGEELRGGLIRSRSDVALWDLGVDGKLGLERLRELEPPLPPALALVMDEGSAAELLASGARGVLSREMDRVRIVAALQAIAQHLIVIDENLAWATLRGRSGEEEAPAETLTPREAEVLQLLSRALSNKEIAQRLDHRAHREVPCQFHPRKAGGPESDRGGGEGRPPRTGSDLRRPLPIR